MTNAKYRFTVIFVANSCLHKFIGLKSLTFIIFYFLSNIGNHQARSCKCKTVPPVSNIIIATYRFSVNTHSSNFGSHTSVGKIYCIDWKMFCLKSNHLDRIIIGYVYRVRYWFDLFNFFNANLFNTFRCCINITGINMCNLYTFSFRTLLFNRLTSKCNFYISIFTPAIIQSLQFACFILHK